MRAQSTTAEKPTRGHSIADGRILMRLRNQLYPLLMLLTKVKVKYRVEVENTYAPIPHRAIIFSASHAAFPDIPIALRATGRHSYVLIGKQNLALEDRIFFGLSGAVWVDRKDKKDMAVSKQTLLGYLRKGQSVLWFPEATWNLTANQLIMHMKWGIVDVARQSNAQIIPVALHYDRQTMTCRVRFGSPIISEENVDKAQEISRLRDAMASLRWELMSSYPILHRSNITPEQLRLDIYRALDEYPPLNWEYERSCIFNPHMQAETTYPFLKPCWGNAFLFNKRLKG